MTLAQIDRVNRAQFDPMQRAREFRWTGPQHGGHLAMLQRMQRLERGLVRAGGVAGSATSVAVVQTANLPEAEQRTVAHFFLQRNNGQLDTLNIGLTDANDDPVIVPLNVLGPGSLDPLLGEFLDVVDPRGVAIDDDGNIYVTSGINVLKFGPDGGLLANWVPGGAVTIATFAANYGTTGSGTAPNFDTPRQITVDATGNLYIADTGNNRIMKLTSGGAYTAHVGSLTAPRGITYDARIDGLWTITQTTGSVVTLRAYSTALVAGSTSAQSGSDHGHLASPTTPPNVSPVFAVIPASDRVYRLQSGLLTISTAPHVDAPYGIAADDEHFYLSSPGDDIIAKFTHAGAFVTAWGGTGSGDGQLDTPRGLAIHPTTGFVYVADTGNDRICAFTNTGGYIGKFGATGSGSGQFNEPEGLAFNAAGTKLYVSDATNDRVTELDVVLPDSLLTGIALDSGGSLYVADAIADTVYVIDSSDGSVDDTIGTTGTGNGELDTPAGIAIDSSNNVYVVDAGNHRVQRFDASTYAYDAQQGGLGLGNGEFNAPAGIAIDAGDRVFVVDQGNRRVQVLDDTLAWVRSFGGYGNSNGQFSQPEGIGFDRDGRCWVTDRSRNDAQAFDVNDDFLDKATGLKTPTAIAFNRNNGLGYLAEFGAGGVSLLQLPLQNFPLLLTNVQHGDELAWNAATQHFENRQGFPVLLTSLNDGDEVEWSSADDAFVNRWGPKGLVLIDGPLAFSAVSAVNFDGYFTSEFENYEIEIVIPSRSASSNTLLRLRVSGSSASGGSDYSWTGEYINQAAINRISDNADSAIALTTWSAATPTDQAIHVRIYRPEVADNTIVHSHWGHIETAGAIGGWLVGARLATTQFDGFALLPSSGTITGAAWIYGYREFP